MYVTDPRGSVYALDAADGHLLWTFDVTDADWRRRGARATSSAIAASLCRRRDLHRRRLVPVRARCQDRRADAGLRQERPGQRRSSTCIQQRYPEVQGGDQPGLLVHHRAADSQRRALHRQHPQREPHPGRACAGGRRQDRQGAVALQHRAAGRKGSGLGHCRSDLGRRRAQRRRHLGDAVDRSRARHCSTSRSPTRSATAPSAPASTCSPTRSWR